jgi:hypothetical protein
VRALSGVENPLVETKGGAMAIFWTAVVIAFVVFTLATVAFGTFRMFGGGQLRH